MALPIVDALPSGPVAKRGFDPREPRDGRGRWTDAPGGDMAGRVLSAVSLGRRERTVQKRKRELDQAETYGSEAERERARRLHDRALERLEADRSSGGAAPTPPTGDGSWVEGVAGLEVHVQKTPGGMMGTLMGDSGPKYIMMVNLQNGGATLVKLGDGTAEERKRSLHAFRDTDNPQAKALTLALARHLTPDEIKAKKRPLASKKRLRVGSGQKIAARNLEAMEGSLARAGLEPVVNKRPAYRINDRMGPGPKEKLAPTGRYYMTGKKREGVGAPLLDAKPPLIESKSLRMTAERQRATLYHEYGHHLDAELGHTWNYATAQRVNKTQTRIVERLLGTRSMRFAHHQHSDKFAEYLRSPEEVWARAFAQWLAVTGGDDKARWDFEHGNWPGHWFPEEFAPVMALFDKMFEDLEWKRKTDS